MEKKFKINISDIKPGEIYIHLPSGKEKVFNDEKEIAWGVINPDNFIAWTDDLNGRKEL